MIIAFEGESLGDKDDDNKNRLHKIESVRFTEFGQKTDFDNKTCAHNRGHEDEVGGKCLLRDKLVLLEVDDDEADVDGENDQVEEDTNHKHVLSSDESPYSR